MRAIAESTLIPYELVVWLTSTSGVYVFGGLLKRIIDPQSAALGDIDVIALNPKAMDHLRDSFGIIFRKMSKPGASPQYFLGKAPLAGSKIIQLVLMRSHAEAMQFTVAGAQFDVDRLVLSSLRLYGDPAIGLNVICQAIRDKRASLVKGPRDMTHFSNNRPQIEQRHKFKLMQKGFTIID